MMGPLITSPCDWDDKVEVLQSVRRGRNTHARCRSALKAPARYVPNLTCELNLRYGSPGNRLDDRYVSLLETMKVGERHGSFLLDA